MMHKLITGIAILFVATITLSLLGLLLYGAIYYTKPFLQAMGIMVVIVGFPIVWYLAWERIFEEWM